MPYGAVTSRVSSRSCKSCIVSMLHCSWKTHCLMSRSSDNRFTSAAGRCPVAASPKLTILNSLSSKTVIDGCCMHIADPCEHNTAKICTECCKDPLYLTALPEYPTYLEVPQTHCITQCDTMCCIFKLEVVVLQVEGAAYRRRSDSKGRGLHLAADFHVCSSMEQPRCRCSFAVWYA